MRTKGLSCVALALLAAIATFADAADYKKDPGPHNVAVDDGIWTDAARNDRLVPWKLYMPADITTPVPVVVWSHGLGGSREGGEYLGRHLASHGYAAFHIQHAGSDAALLRGGRAALVAAAQTPDVAIQRLLDMPFVVAEISRMQREGKYAGRFDLEHMGVSGHSYGAISTLVAAGQALGPKGARLPVPAFKGAFAMSPSPPRKDLAYSPYTQMLMPIFHLTGTRDGSPLEETMLPIDRRVAFDTIDNVDQYLLILKDGVHMTFSGRGNPSYRGLERHHELVLMAAVAFWDSVLKNDAVARAWLDDGGFAAAVGDAGTFEVKKAKAPE